MPTNIHNSKTSSGTGAAFITGDIPSLEIPYTRGVFTAGLYAINEAVTCASWLWNKLYLEEQ